jgi:RNA polymerase sigma-70 factor (ECF subfamily)
LPARQREAVILHYWDDRSIEGCAAAMGVSPGSVKQHLTRARQRLAAELGPTAADPTAAHAHPADLELETP